jgi:hypothetical protein
MKWMDAMKPKVVADNESDQKVARLILVLSCFGFGTYLIALIARAGVSVPFKDELAFVGIYSSLAQGNLPTLGEIIAVHSGHPYLVLKSLIVATLSLRLPWVWMMYAQVFILIGCAYVVYCQAIRTPGHAAVPVLAAALVLLSPRQWGNLYWAMQIAFPLSLASGFCSFYFAGRFQLERRLGLLAASLGLALFASISSGAGFVAFCIVILALLALRPQREQRWLIVGTGILGVGLYVVAQAFSVHRGVGQASVDLAQSLSHALLMLTNTIAFFSPEQKYIALLIGSLIAIVAAYCLWLAVRAWPLSIFELSCLAWGLLVILAITYARLSAGIFQPDAPRYVTLVMPLVVGCVLILQRTEKRFLIHILTAALAIGWFQSAISEWKTTPYRKANLTRELTDLCAEGRVSVSYLSPSQINDIRTFFCRE